MGTRSRKSSPVRPSYPAARARGSWTRVCSTLTSVGRHRMSKTFRGDPAASRCSRNCSQYSLSVTWLPSSCAEKWDRQASNRASVSQANSPSAPMTAGIGQKSDLRADLALGNAFLTHRYRCLGFLRSARETCSRQHDPLCRPA